LLVQGQAATPDALKEACTAVAEAVANPAIFQVENKTN
jgi:hypothetical protein